MPILDFLQRDAVSKAPHVVQEGIRTLGWIGDDRAKGYVRSFLAADTDITTTKRAKFALSMIKIKNAPDNIQQLRHIVENRMEPYREWATLKLEAL